MSFNAEQFINSTVNAPMSTATIVCPEGEWTAVISDEGDLADWFRTVEWKDKKSGADRSSPAIRIPFLITDQRARAIAKRSDDAKLYAYMDSFLDLDHDGNLDTSEGKNVKLGALRAALGQNNAGTPWTFSMLRGAGPVIVKVSQRSFDDKDPSRKAADVVRVLRMS